MREADAVVLPGVGGFRTAAERIKRKELRDLARSGKPIMGICLGMQLFFEASEEGPGRGLSLLPGRVKRFPRSVKVPQIGWNTLRVARRTELTEGLPDESWVYYVNSYYPAAVGDWVVATSDYGVEFPGMVERGNVVGTQFHPEKSGKTGALVLRRMLRLAR
jgi:glutamine amidotransferase